MKILITGITGFIGRNVASALMNRGHQLIAMVRPGKKEIVDKSIIALEVDLALPEQVYSMAQNLDWDIILHIGALRGGRPYSNDIFYKVNVSSTQKLAELALENHRPFIFCSSVGIWGTIPESLPANDSTPRTPDTYYHFTKIKAENIIHSLVQKGLRAVIIRPSITYGRDDYGFPYTLVKLVNKGLLFPPTRDIDIHLTNIHNLARAFVYFVETPFIPGKAYTVADYRPVNFKKLINYIYQNLHGETYPNWKRFPSIVYDLLAKLSALGKFDLWKSRFELISKSWYYDVNEIYKAVPLKEVDTIQAFKEVIEWFKEIQ